jgi:flavin-dependent dehydrogenase
MERAGGDGSGIPLRTGVIAVVTDIFIVGGGPAGLAAAIAMRRKGFSVTVADGIRPPADKACGEGLMPAAIAALSNLGVSIGAADSFPFWGIRFLDRGTAVDAKFPVGCARGVRRTTLHRMMAEQAEAVGVQLRWGATVDLGALRCGWIIGADGENSLVRKWASLDVRVRDRRRFGFRRHYRIEPWTDYMELYWGKNCQVYVTPVTRDSVCVAAISRHSQLRLDDALLQFPDLGRKLSSSAIISTERGAITSTRRLKAVYRERVALVGDASGSVDAITGEGLCLAFRQATALTEAIERGDLTTYQRKHSQIARRPEWMARLLVVLGDHPRIRRAAMCAMHARPGIFSSMLAVHAGAFYEINHTDPSDHDYGAAWTGDGPRAEPGSDTRPIHPE